jgi:PBP1b-binding outer membrane lipoprotein LpoB
MDDGIVSQQPDRRSVMKSLLILALLLSGCASMSPAQKKWTGIVVGVAVVGAIAAHEMDSGKPAIDDKKGTVRPACQVQKGC